MDVPQRKIPLIFRSSGPDVFCKKGFLEIMQNSQDTPVLEPKINFK